MHSQLKSIRADLNKGKCSSKVSNVVEELQYLTEFNSSISQAMAKTMEHLSDFVFVTVANSTLARRDAYLSHLKAGIKLDTLASLRTAPLQMATLFPDETLKQAEQDIATFETKSQPPSGTKKGRFHPYDRTDKRSDNRKQDRPAWKNLGYRGQSKRGRGKASHYTSRPAKGQQSYKCQSICSFTSARAAARELTDSKTCSVYPVSQVYQQDIRFSNQEQFKCKLKCCKACTFCQRAITKERCKSRYCNILSREIKIYEKCFFCHSLDLCTTCKKCQKCCSNSSCRDQTSKFLANLARPGCRSKSGSDPKRGLHSSLSDPTKTHKVPHSHKLLCQSSQEQLPVRGITSAYRQKCSGTSTKPGVPRVLQPALFSSKTKQQVETYPGSEQIESFPQGGEIQNGDTGNHQDLPSDGRVGHLNRLQRRLLPHTNTRTIQEIPEISCPGSDLPVQGSAFRFGYSTLGVHGSSKRGETDGLTQGYKNPPVPRRLVGESHIPPGLSPTYQDFSPDMSGSRLTGKFREIRTGAKTSFRLRGLSVRPPVGSSATHTRTLAKPPTKNTGTVSPTDLSGPGFHVFNRFANSHRETSPPRSSSHEANSMAFEKQLESTGIPREGHSNSQVLAPTLTMVVGRKECPHRPTTTPSKTCSANLYRRIKRRVGRSFKRAHCERNSNSNSNSTFIALNLCQKTDSKAHHTKTLFNIQKPETLQGSAPRRKQKGDWKFRVGMLFQRGMTSTLT